MKKFNQLNQLAETAALTLFKGVTNPMPAEQVTTTDRLREILQSEDVTRLTQQVRRLKAEGKAYDTLKRRQAAITPNGCIPTGTSRCAANAQPTPYLGIDLDHIDPDKAWAQIEGMKDSLGLLLAMKSISGEGLFLLLASQPGWDAQKQFDRFEELTGLHPDPSCKDICRLRLLSSLDDVYYLDEAMFQPNHINLLRQHLSPQSPATGQPAPAAQPQTAATTSRPGSMAGRRKYQGFTFKEITQAYLRLYNGGEQPQQGSREMNTNKLAFILAPLCDYDPRKVMQVLPRFDHLPLDEYQRTVTQATLDAKSATQKKQQGGENPYAALDRIIRHLHKTRLIHPCEQAMPPMPTDLPQPLQSIAECVEPNYRPYLIGSIFPAFAAHIGKAEAEYVNKVSQPLVLMHLVIAPSATGKSLRRPFTDTILHDIQERDEKERRRQAEWSSLSQKQREKTPRPTGLIQCISANATYAALRDRFVEATKEGKSLYIDIPELGLAKGLSEKNSMESFWDTIKTAFDGEYTNSERSTQTYETFQTKLNLCASTQPVRTTAYIDNNTLVDGGINRFDLSTIHLKDYDDHIPQIQVPDDALTLQIKPHLALLDEAEGRYLCPEANQLVQELSSELQEEASILGDKALSELIRRALVIGWRKAVILWLMNSQAWDERIARFMEWSIRYDLWCKMTYFGKRLAEQIERGSLIASHSRSTVLDMLPETFTKNDLVKCAPADKDKQQKDEWARNTLNNWLGRPGRNKRIVYDEIRKAYTKIA